MNLAIFDIDGTLVRPFPTEDPCFAEALRSTLRLERAVEPDWSTYENVTDFGLLHDVSSRYRGRAATVDEMSAFRSGYLSAFLRSVEPEHGAEIPGAVSFFEHLRGQPGWFVAVATGNVRDLAVWKLERAGARDLNVPMATADDGVSRQTLLRLALERALERFGVGTFDHIVSIGDAVWDLRTARALGLPFLAVGERCGPPPGRGIADYTDPDEVMKRLAAAVCW